MEPSKLFSDYILETRAQMQLELADLMKQFQEHRSEGFIWHFCILPEKALAAMKALTIAGIDYRTLESPKIHWFMVQEADVKAARGLL